MCSWMSPLTITRIAFTPAMTGTDSRTSADPRRKPNPRHHATNAAIAVSAVTERTPLQASATPRSPFGRLSTNPFRSTGTPRRGSIAAETVVVVDWSPNWSGTSMRFGIGSAKSRKTSGKGEPFQVRPAPGDEDVPHGRQQPG